MPRNNRWRHLAAASLAVTITASGLGGCTQKPAPAPTPRPAAPTAAVATPSATVQVDYEDALAPIPESLLADSTETTPHDLFFALMQEYAQRDRFTQPGANEAVLAMSVDESDQLVAQTCSYWDAGKSIEDVETEKRHDFALTGKLATSSVCPELIDKFVKDVMDAQLKAESSLKTPSATKEPAVAKVAITWRGMLVEMWAKDFPPAKREEVCALFRRNKASVIDPLVEGATGQLPKTGTGDAILENVTNEFFTEKCSA